MLLTNSIYRQANFSNALRRRFIKSQLTKGMPGNYVQNIRQVRGKVGTDIASNSPLVKDLADLDYIQDPLDIGYIQSAADDMVRRGHPGISEQGFDAFKYGRGISPSTREAKLSWLKRDSIPVGGGKVMTDLDNVPTMATGRVNMHTHPIGGSAAPSPGDLISTRATETASAGFLQTPLVQNQGRNRDYILTERTPGNAKLTRYAYTNTRPINGMATLEEGIGIDAINTIASKAALSEGFRNPTGFTNTIGYELRRTSNKPNSFYGHSKAGKRWLDKVDSRVMDAVNELPNFETRDLGYMEIPLR